MIERIGSGGYGEVWLCRNVVGTLRAVKVVRRAEFDDERPYEREFNGIRKFEPISRTHEGFVNILQIGRNDPEGFFYYVMELADPIPTPVAAGVRRLTLNSHEPESEQSLLTSAATNYSPRTLALELKSKGALSVPEVLQIAIKLAEALAELHRHGLVHRDIKPSNIIFVGGVPKLADIGLVSSATESKSFVGTEGYIPPEGPGSVQADLYSLGIVLYVLATGKHHRDFPEPPENLSTLPAADRQQFLELTAIIHKAAQTNPRDRYQTAQALLADLERLSAGHSVKRRHTRHQAFNFLCKTAAVASVLSILVLILKHEHQRRALPAVDNRPPWEKAGTTNKAAWEAWQRALQMANTYSAQGLSNAIQEWERSVALDPNAAICWHGLSITMTIAVNDGYFAGTNLLPRARECSERALKLNPQGGYPLVSLALCNLAQNYDFAQAEPLFRRGIELNPQDFAHRINFGMQLIYNSRFREAEHFFSQVREEHPQRASPFVNLGYIACLTEDFAGGLELFNQGLRLEPDHPRWRMMRGDVLWADGQTTAAARDLLRQVELGGFFYLDRDSDGALLRETLHASGPEVFLRQLISLSLERQKQGLFVSGYDLGRLYAMAGENQKALDHLEVAIREQRGTLMGIKVNPVFRNLRQEPRFHALLQRLNLEK